MRSAGRVLGACIPMTAICLWISGASMWTESGGWIVKSVALFGGIGLSIVAYLGVHLVLGSGGTGRGIGDGETQTRTRRAEIQGRMI